MNCLVFIIGFGLLFSFVLGDNVTAIVNLTDSSPTYTWKVTDEPSITIGAEDGYQIQVDVNKVDVQGENGDYIKVKINSEDEDNVDALMFSYTVTGQPSYLYNRNEVQADYIGNSETNSFEIKFTRVGEATTTTSTEPPTSSTEPMPTASPDENATLTVYLYGRSAGNYRAAEILQLEQAIAGMGTEYCNIQNCPLNESISTNHVKIELLEACPIAWLNHDSCAKLIFALPIVKNEDQSGSSLWDGYQLNEDHLRQMWDNYAEKYMKDIDLDLYQVPNVGSIFTKRLIVICLVIVILILLIIGSRAIISRISKKKRRVSDTTAIIGQDSNRASRSSLRPHFLQTVPPLFNNDFPIYPDQKGQKYYSDSFTDDMDASSPSIPSVLNIAGNDPEELHDAEA